MVYAIVAPFEPNRDGRSDKKYLARIEHRQFLSAGDIVLTVNRNGFVHVCVMASAEFDADDGIVSLWNTDTDSVQTIVSKLTRHDFKPYDEDAVMEELPAVEI